MLGGENTVSCLCFLSVLLIVVSFSLSVRLFSSQHTSLCLFFSPSDSPPHPTGEGEGVSHHVVLCCNLKQNRNSSWCPMWGLNTTAVLYQMCHSCTCY